MDIFQTVSCIYIYTDIFYALDFNNLQTLRFSSIF